MTNEEFDALVRKLEREVRQQPRRYKVKVFALALLGYAYVLFVVTVLAMLTAALAVLLVMGKAFVLIGKLALPLVALVGVVGRALWVRLAPPDGLRLHSRDFPVLFRALEDIRRKLKGPRIHAVMLDDAFNASVSQLPRLGLFGWQRNYLVLGLPLMQALSPEQFLAVLAHEYGHLAGAHSGFGTWIYRVRQTWHRLMVALNQQRHWGKFIFARFFTWYAPFFSAYSFVLARANEYEADACSAAVVDPRHVADALITYRLKANFLRERFWPHLYRQADRVPQPAFSPYEALTSEMRKKLDDGEAQDWLNEALTWETGTEDTHPALKDRLAALRQEARLPTPAMQTAAQHFFGERLPMLTERFDAEWRQREQASWQERHQYVQSSTQRLQELESEKAQRDLDAAERYAYAVLAEEFRPQADHVALYREVLALSPEHVSAHYRIGRLLLSSGDDAGLGHLEKVMAVDEDAITDGCKLVYKYLMSTGREEEAKTYADRYHRQAEREAQRQQERDRLMQNDRLAPHGLDDDAVRALVSQLAQHRAVAKAFLAQKVLQHGGDPLYVLGIARRWWSASGATSNKKLAQKLIAELKFPGETFVLVLDNDNQRLAKTLKKVSGTRIYSRGRQAAHSGEPERVH